MKLRITYNWLLVLAVISFGCSSKRSHLKIEQVDVDSLTQIEVINDSIVKPILYNHIRGLDSLPSPDVKKLFISAILPAILVSKYHLSELRSEIHELANKENWTPEDSAFYHQIKNEYKASDLDNLLLRLSTVPNSIVLGQAALESGWGKSRFFREANNIFGMWSYNSDEPRLSALQKREDKTVHVRVYENLSQSIDDYFKTLATARAYRHLRMALRESNNVEELLPHLKYYSERRMEYVNQLRQMIDYNELRKYDDYQIDPKYFVEQ